jgi:hypothetical protein
MGQGLASGMVPLAVTSALNPGATSAEQAASKPDSYSLALVQSYYGTLHSASCSDYGAIDKRITAADTCC